jgi:cytoskeletal protein CcmA (bactofilin family)
MSKKKVFSWFLALSFCAFLPFAAQAFSVKSGESVIAPKDQVVDGNLYAAASTISIDGQVMGDVICAGQTVNISAKVDGDVICAAQTINISGEVKGNVRVAASSINISGTIGRNLNAFAATVVISEPAKIGWDALVAAANTEMRGQVGGSLHGSMKSLVISGQVGKNVDVKIDQSLNDDGRGKLEITEMAKVEGDVIYTGVDEAQIIKDNVNGQIVHNLPPNIQNKMIMAKIWGRIYAIFAALVVGLVLLSLWRKQIIEITSKMMEHKIGETIGWGAIVLFLPPIAAVILLFTVIGIPLALIVGSLWVLALFVARIIFAIMVGRFLMQKAIKKQTEKLFLEMTVGVAICWIVFALPLIGWLGLLVAMWWALGAMWNFCRKR